jgi:hypothetical protein
MPDAPAKNDTKVSSFFGDKPPMWALIIAAFSGGIVLQMAELMGMMHRHEAADMFFFGGMLVAGAMGIGGLFLAGATSLRSAVAAGISAPQLLGGIMKAVPATALLLNNVMAPVYAQPTTIDSVKVTVEVESTLTGVTISTLDGSWSAKVQDGIKLTIPKVDSLKASMDEETVVFPLNIDTADSKSVLKITTQHTTNGPGSFLRGLLGQRTKMFDRQMLQVKSE